jgi:hypothetical protein
MPTPFGSIYASLIAPLATAEVAAIAGNLIRHDIEYPALIESPQSGDLPSLELLIEPGAPVNIWNSGDTARVDMLFRLIYRTDQEQLAASIGLFELFWAVLRAFFTAGVKLGNSYITQWDITTWEPLEPYEVLAEPGIAEDSEQGWQSSMQILVHTEIPHSELLVT